MAKVTIDQLRQKSAELGRPLALSDATSSKTTWRRLLGADLLEQARAEGLISSGAGKRPRQRAGVMVRHDLSVVYKLSTTLTRKSALAAVMAIADCDAKQAESLIADAKKWHARRQAEQKLREQAETLLSELRKLMAAADVDAVKVTADSLVILRYK